MHHHHSVIRSERDSQCAVSCDGGESEGEETSQWARSQATSSGGRRGTDITQPHAQTAGSAGLSEANQALSDLTAHFVSSALEHIACTGRAYAISWVYRAICGVMGQFGPCDLPPPLTGLNRETLAFRVVGDMMRSDVLCCVGKWFVLRGGGGGGGEEEWQQQGAVDWERDESSAAGHCSADFVPFYDHQAGPVVDSLSADAASWSPGGDYAR
jgi:hypothetical protein